MYSPDSIEPLQKAGIDFQRHEEIGIQPNDFAELMITSGLVLSHDAKWISFHRYVRSDSSLMSLLRCRPLVTVAMTLDILLNFLRRKVYQVQKTLFSIF